MTELNFKNFLARLYTKSFVEEDLMSSAAQVAFYFAFALFPLLLFLVTLFGLVLESADELRSEMFYYLRQVMPLTAFNLVKTTIDEVTENSSGGKLTVGILIAIWSASAGVDSVRVALNGVYNVPDLRAYWKTKPLSLMMTLGLGLLITIALGVVFYGSKFTMLILNTINLPIQSPFVLGVLQWVIILFVLITIFAIIYNYLPAHRKHSFVWITPGTVAGIILWLSFSYAFRLYLEYFNTYAKTYGSLGAMIILMLWLYLTALVILIGGSINAVLQEFTDPETAKAGANKAAAKEIIENPDKPIEEVSKNPDELLEAAPNKAKQTETPVIEEHQKDIPAKLIEKPRVEIQESDDTKPQRKFSKKVVRNLLVGSLFGVFFGLFFSKKKRGD